MEQDPLRMHEDSHSAVGQHRATMYDKKEAGGDENAANDRTTPSKRQSNSINRRPSVVSGRCPFSGQMMGGDA